MESRPQPSFARTTALLILECALALLAVAVYRCFAIDLRGGFIATLAIGSIVGFGIGLVVQRPIAGTLIGFSASVFAYALAMWYLIRALQAQ